MTSARRQKKKCSLVLVARQLKQYNKETQTKIETGVLAAL